MSRREIWGAIGDPGVVAVQARADFAACTSFPCVLIDKIGEHVAKGARCRRLRNNSIYRELAGKIGAEKTTYHNPRDRFPQYSPISFGDTVIVLLFAEKNAHGEKI